MVESLTINVGIIKHKKHSIAKSASVKYNNEVKNIIFLLLMHSF
jgi:hypothetical protein